MHANGGCWDKVKVKAEKSGYHSCKKCGYLLIYTCFLSKIAFFRQLKIVRAIRIASLWGFSVAKIE